MTNGRRRADQDGYTGFGDDIGAPVVVGSREWAKGEDIKPEPEVKEDVGERAGLGSKFMKWVGGRWIKKMKKEGGGDKLLSREARDKGIGRDNKILITIVDNPFSVGFSKPLFELKIHIKDGDITSIPMDEAVFMRIYIEDVECLKNLKRGEDQYGNECTPLIAWAHDQLMIETDDPSENWYEKKAYFEKTWDFVLNQMPEEIMDHDPGEEDDYEGVTEGVT